jgi:hypothetical protein
MKLPKKDIEWLDDAITSCQIKVHAVGCKQTDKCPRLHKHCRRGLNDRTAIIWTIRDKLQSIRWGLENVSDTKRIRDNIRFAGRIMEIHSSVTASFLYSISKGLAQILRGDPMPRQWISTKHSIRGRRIK